MDESENNTPQQRNDSSISDSSNHPRPVSTMDIPLSMRGNNGNLVPMQFRTKERQREIASMGGKMISPAKSISAKLRWLKQSKKISPEQAQKLVEVISDPLLSALDVRMIIEKAIAKIGPDAKDYQILNASNLLMQWHKMTHGEKLKTENTNLNINVTMTEWERRLYDGEKNVTP